MIVKTMFHRTERPAGGTSVVPFKNIVAAAVL